MANGDTLKKDDGDNENSNTSTSGSSRIEDTQPNECEHERISTNFQECLLRSSITASERACVCAFILIFDPSTETIIGQTMILFFMKTD